CISGARGITDHCHGLGRDMLVVPARTDPAAFGTPTDQILRGKMAQTLDDLGCTRGAPKGLLVLRAGGDHRSQALERTNPLASLLLTLPQAPAEVAVEHDTASFPVPLDPATEVLKAGRGAEGEGNSGHQEKLGTSEETLELRQAGGAQELPRSRPSAPVREAGAVRRIHRQAIDAGLTLGRRLREPNAFARQ